MSPTCLSFLLATLLATAASASASDACDPYGWQVCTSDTDCTSTKCATKDSDGTLADQCQYGSYTCVVPSIPSCTVKRCVPVPESAFVCSTDADCATVTAEVRTVFALSEFRCPVSLSRTTPPPTPAPLPRSSGRYL